MKYTALHDLGVKHGFDIRIEEHGTVTKIKVPAWIGSLPDHKAEPILAGLNRALLELSKEHAVVLSVYV